MHAHTWFIKSGEIVGWLGRLGWLAGCVQVGYKRVTTMVSARVAGALMLLLAVYTHALPIQENSFQLHESGKLFSRGSLDVDGLAAQYCSKRTRACQPWNHPFRALWMLSISSTPPTIKQPHGRA